MPTIKQLQSEAKLNSKSLATYAGVSETALRKLRRGEAVKPEVAGKVCEALSNQLNRKIVPSEIEGLAIL